MSSRTFILHNEDIVPHTVPNDLFSFYKKSVFNSPIALGGTPAESFGRKGKGGVSRVRADTSVLSPWLYACNRSKRNKIRLHAEYQTVSCTKSIVVLTLRSIGIFISLWLVLQLPGPFPPQSDPLYTYIHNN